MRARLAVLSMVVALTVAGSAEARGPAARDPHLRPANPTDAALVSEAVTRSPTIQALADRLKETDLIAYVSLTPMAAGERDSSVRFLGRSRVERFMVITVNDALSLDRQIALVGHELQHAVDMSKAPWVTDASRMQTYFTMVGRRNAYPEQGFETLSAMQTERKVSKELVTAEAVTGQGHVRPR